MHTLTKTHHLLEHSGHVVTINSKYNYLSSRRYQDMTFAKRQIMVSSTATESPAHAVELIADLQNVINCSGRVLLERFNRLKGSSFSAVVKSVLHLPKLHN